MKYIAEILLALGFILLVAGIFYTFGYQYALIASGLHLTVLSVLIARGR